MPQGKSKPVARARTALRVWSCSYAVLVLALCGCFLLVIYRSWGCLCRQKRGKSCSDIWTQITMGELTWGSTRRFRGRSYARSRLGMQRERRRRAYQGLRRRCCGPQRGPRATCSRNRYANKPSQDRQGRPRPRPGALRTRAKKSRSAPAAFAHCQCLKHKTHTSSNSPTQTTSNCKQQGTCCLLLLLLLRLRSIVYRHTPYFLQSSIIYSTRV
jgi:hypothetical protein